MKFPPRRCLALLQGAVVLCERACGLTLMVSLKGTRTARSPWSLPLLFDNNRVLNGRDRVSRHLVVDYLVWLIVWCLG